MTDLIGGIVRVEPDWNALPPKTPPGTRSIVKRCLQKDRRHRFHAIGDVRIAFEESPTVQPAAITPDKKSARRAWVVSGILLITIAAVLAAINFNPGAAPRHTSRFLIELPPETSPYLSVASPFPSISPDGRYLAFLGYPSGLSRLWLRPIGSLEAQIISGTGLSIGNPFWSPDGRFIGVFGQGKLQKISVTGDLQTLCEADGLGGTWNQDDVIVFQHRNSLYRIAAAGGASTEIRTPNASSKEVRYSWPSFLPDGRHFLYLVQKIGS